MSEIIIVRSLTESDMGVFRAHRNAATSKQRAIALTTVAAERLLSPRLYAAESAVLDTICVYGAFGNRERRHIGKVGKNWRFGGHQLTGSEFADLDSKDFVLFRSIGQNDSDSPILMTFVGRRREQLVHAGIVGFIGTYLKHSVAIISKGSTAFEAVAMSFPAIPPALAVYVPADEPEML